MSVSSKKWNEVPFSEIIEGSAFGPRFSGDSYADDGNIVTLRTTDISADGTISYAEAPRAKLDEAKFENHFLQVGDLVITRSGRVGTTAVFEGHDDPVLPGAFLIRFRLRQNADPKFYRYWFNSQLGQNRLLSVARGAAQQNINITNVVKIKVQLPPLNAQHRIADILSAYDDLIENNRRRIDLLEQSARMLYKEWFISLRFPGHEHVKVKDGVPQGWEKAVFADIGEDIRDSVRPEQVDPQTPYIGLEHIPRRSITLMDWGSAEDVTSNKFRFVEGDILFGKIRPYFHKVGFALTDGITSSDTIVMRPTHEKFFSYLLMTASSDHFVKMVSQTVKEGSKMPRANWDIMQQYPVFIPSDNVLYSFSEVIENIVKQLKALALQNQKLQQARDLLLPRLMNGEIPV